VVFGPETLAARAALGGVTHEILDSTTSVAGLVTDLDGVPGLGSGPHAPSASSGHAPTPLPPDSPLFENYQPTPPGPQFTTADGGLIYPDDSLPTKPYALPGTVIPEVRLPEGTVVDRFGHPGGSWMSPEGVPFAERSLPPSSVEKSYYQYVVADPAKLPPGYTIERSLAAPWFGQPGGGVQYRILDPDGNNASIQDLIDAQYLRRVER
jgi:Tuberculosis necrotizing toxin